MSNHDSNDAGLDFGSGPDSSVSRILSESGLNLDQYDIFFKNDKALLNKKYDFITACEVIEHFRKPDNEFTLLKNLLKSDGKLYCMTYIYDPSIDFSKWYYKNDITHFFIYQKKTIETLSGIIGFSKFQITGRIIVFYMNNLSKN